MTSMFTSPTISCELRWNFLSYLKLLINYWSADLAENLAFRGQRDQNRILYQLGSEKALILGWETVVWYIGLHICYTGLEKPVHPLPRRGPPGSPYIIYSSTKPPYVPWVMGPPLHCAILTKIWHSRCAPCIRHYRPTKRVKLHVDRSPGAGSMGSNFQCFPIYGKTSRACRIHVLIASPCAHTKRARNGPIRCAANTFRHLSTKWQHKLKYTV